ncbi:MAG: hypothetical protein ACNS61_15660 [Candidatus Wenzhouxiangella sp. M2_3B_020]
MSMTSVLRIAGVMMMVAGGLLMASWFVEPLRALWPWLLDLPLPIRIGLAVSALGLLIVFATVVHDRLRADDRSLREELGDDS